MQSGRIWPSGAALLHIPRVTILIFTTSIILHAKLDTDERGIIPFFLQLAKNIKIDVLFVVDCLKKKSISNLHFQPTLPLPSFYITIFKIAASRIAFKISPH